MTELRAGKPTTGILAIEAYISTNTMVEIYGDLQQVSFMILSRSLRGVDIKISGCILPLHFR